MLFRDAIKRRTTIEEALESLGARLKTYPRNNVGLTPDSVKFSPEYREIKSAHDREFARLRAVNSFLLKTYPAEMKALRKLSRR
jgi:hypothetical protein